MWMGKIGNKSAAFIRHKHFHPGTYQNMEKVWLAEEKQKAEERRQKEMKEKREEELKTLEIKRQIREQEELKRMEMILEEKRNKYKVDRNFVSENQSGLILTGPATSSTSPTPKSTNKEEKKLVIRSQYNEDVLKNGHTTVFGSYYDRDKKSWGYKCCKLTEKEAKCPEAKPKYKRKNPDSETADRNSNKQAKKSANQGSGLTDSLKLLKQMDALE
ncbi:N-terminal domain of CBF1 interacting co-repressor CIR family protein [Theileria parva strain Muguga]|uniref:N-terminal domain of CBF1 interacting co-repressor CIR family protein n=1 Tax=Theileria parva strain Muguga TaxID=333668 RepID=UPI001C6173F8|nr:N-terminal domain of CBF1 interacting co-repressor CIR family protein [Theileria parva strain Muguga]EAN34327.2 N-terminal domain of CBF1 interacting co-repressor CIR family protein [Theileria parva strain Muguga]